MDTNVLNSDQRHFVYENPWIKLGFNLVGVLAAAALVATVFGIGSTAAPGGQFFSPVNLRNISFFWLAHALLVIPVVLIVAAGGLDLSIGAVMGLTAMLAATWAPQMGQPVAALAALLVALGIGLVNGLLAGSTRIHSAILTLGMAVLLRSLTILLSGGNFKTVEGTGFIASSAFLWVGLVIALLLGIPLLIVSMRRPAAKPGQPAERWLVRLFHTASPFILSGFMAGLVGLAYLGRLRTATLSLGNGFEVDMLVVAVIGGTPLGNLPISLGLVNMLGGFLAAMALALTQNAILIAGGQVTLLDLIKAIALVSSALISYIYYSLLGRWKSRPKAPQAAPAPVQTT